MSLSKFGRGEYVREYVKYGAARLLAVAAVLLLAISGFAFLMEYEGTIGPFLLFDLSYLLLILLAVPKPRLYVYTFLSLLLFLGFWVKFMAHAIVGYAFVELTGRFDGSGESWDRVLLVASSAAIGVASVRCLHLWYARYVSAKADDSPSRGGIPLWYLRFRKPIWIGTILLIIGFNGWNMVARFHQIGVEPRVVLPAHLNVVAAWLIVIGFALWIAVLVYWEASRDRSTLNRALFAPIAEGAISTISQLSRSAYVFHTVPYVFVLAERGLGLRSALTKKAVRLLTVLFVLGVVLSLVVVSGLRLYTYPISMDGDNRDAAISGMAGQVLGLFVDRWIGLEGVLAVSAYPDLGGDLFVAGILEDPNAGETSIYQVISGADALYSESEEFTFMTLPGSAAVLYYSGSLLVVGFGMAVIVLVLMGIELVSSEFIGNPFLLSVSGMATANIISQLYSPYLAGVFLAELVVALGFVWLIQTASASNKQDSASHESAQR